MVRSRKSKQKITISDSDDSEEVQIIDQQILSEKDTSARRRCNFHIKITLFDRQAYAKKDDIFRGLQEIATDVVVTSQNLYRDTHQAVDETFLAYCYIPKPGLFEFEIESKVKDVLNAIGPRKVIETTIKKEIRFIKIKNVDDALRKITIIDIFPLFTESIDTELFHSKYIYERFIK